MLTYLDTGGDNKAKRAGKKVENLLSMILSPVRHAPLALLQ